MPTSFGDFQKANKDLAKFAAGKKTFKLKAKSAVGDKFAVKYGVGKSLSVEGSRKTSAINYKKVSADTDGHFEFETELNDAIADITIGMDGKIGSTDWQAKNSEELNLNLDYSTNDLAFSSSSNLLAKGGVTSNLELSYAYDAFTFGGSVGLGLPLALVPGDKGELLQDASVGLTHKSGDITVGAVLSGVHQGKNAGVGLSVLHNCSNDTTWGAVVNTDASKKVDGSLAVESKLDGQTTFTFGLNKNGIINLKYAQNVSSSLKMTYEAEINTKSLADDQKFGLGIEMSA
jgi:hypothetical protein